MSIENISTEIIDPNPYQRRLDLGDLDELAEDIKENGLLQVPLARRMNGRVQLALGHRREAAWEIAFPGQAMPLDIRELSDRQMFDYVIAENAQRKDLSAIEKAQAITDYMSNFDVTLTDSARRFNMSQSTASNLTRLLELPKVTRELVHTGDVPERLARELVQFARAGLDKLTDEISVKIAEARPGEKEEMASNRIADAMHEFQNLNEWPTNWVVTLANGKHIEAQQCKGCAFCLSRSYMFGQKRRTDSYCAHKKKGCMEEKRSEWALHELERVSKDTGIPIAQPGDGAEILDINWHNDDKVRQLVQRTIKPKCLRVMVRPIKSNSWEFSVHREILNSSHVVLASTEKNILNKKADEIKKAIAAAETPSDKKKREAEEERERAKNRTKRSAQRKAMNDIAWLIFNTAKATAQQLVASGAALALLDELNNRSTSRPMAGAWPEFFVPLNEMVTSIKKQKDVQSKDELLRQHVIIRCIATKVSAFRPDEQYDFDRAIKRIEEVTKALGLILPPGWSDVPIHKTESNCHVCGVFTSQPQITKLDHKKGWMVIEGIVTCSGECRDRMVTEMMEAERPKKRKGKRQ